MVVRSSFIFSVCFLISPFLLATGATAEKPTSTIGLDRPLEIKSSDEAYSIKLGGRVQWDYNYAELNGQADEDEFSLRRARLYLSGKMNDWSYKMQFNLGNGNGGTHEDLYIRYNGWGKRAVVTIGKQNEPFGLERIESSKDISYLERSAITEAYTPGRSEGILISGQKDNMTYAFGVFEDDALNDKVAVTGRVTYAPINSTANVLHLGVAHSHRDENLDISGFELAYTKGSFHLQSEFIVSEKEGKSQKGYYLQTGWILTGETRPYKNGIFKRVKSSDHSGAWELVARYEDGDGAYSDQELGFTDARSYGIGVNYYLNQHIRIGASFTEAKDNVTDDEGSELRARIQIAL